MYQSLIIIDDLLDNAHDIRAAAKRFEYPHYDANYFAGRNSRQRVNIEGLSELASEIVREPLEPKMRSGHGCFRLTLEGDEKTAGYGGVHVDECHWSGIYYLSLPEHCQGGTDFFRHKSTGLEVAPFRREHLEQAGVSSADEFNERILKPEQTDMSKWERTMQVPMRFNRLVLFRPWLWHTATPGFGDTFDNGRLIHLLFFNKAGTGE